MINYKLYISGTFQQAKPTRSGYKILAYFYAGYTDQEPDEEEDWALRCPMNMVFSSGLVSYELDKNDPWFPDGFAKTAYDKLMQSVYIPEKLKEIKFEDIVFCPKIELNFRGDMPPIDLEPKENKSSGEESTQENNIE